MSTFLSVYVVVIQNIRESWSDKFLRHFFFLIYSQLLSFCNSYYLPFSVCVPFSRSEESITGAATGNTNKTKVSEALPLNPRTLEVLSKKEARLLSRCAETAGVTLKEYVSKINCTSPEWKWLGSFQKN